MDRTILFAVVCILFLARDARLVVSRPWVFVVAVPVALTTTVACAMTAELLSGAELQRWAEDRRFWMTALGVDGLQSFRSSRWRRRAVRSDWIMLLPGPMLCMALMHVCHFALARIDGGTGLIVGLAFGVSWVVTVGLALVIRTLPAGQSDGVRLASFAHFAALLSIPFLALSQGTAHSIDWAVTGGVMGTVILLVGASFAWHQSGHSRKIEP